MRRIIRLLRSLPPYTLTALCLAAICWLTLASRPLGDTEVQLFPHADKVAHALMFGGFAFCIIADRVRRPHRAHCSTALAITAAVLSIALGIATEWLQTAMHAGRSGDPLDLAADAVGAITVATACRLAALKR